jgi:hypothetical protein
MGSVIFVTLVFFQCSLSSGNVKHVLLWLFFRQSKQWESITSVFGIFSPSSVRKICTFGYFHLFAGKDCQTTATGEDYRGQISITRSGKTCQAWSESVTSKNPR